MAEKIDPEIFELIPHRPPMLLINSVITVDRESSESLVFINKESPFYVAGLGVPAWIGMEYMGQTAALIAGYQKRKGLIEPHMGFLITCRKFEANVCYYNDKQVLNVSCNEVGVVGNNLATFACSIYEQIENDELVTATLSVFRKPLDNIK